MDKWNRTEPALKMGSGFHAWRRLSRDQRVAILLDQTEWAVFQANVVDVIIDRRTINGLVLSRRLLFSKDRNSVKAQTITARTEDVLAVVGEIKNNASYVPSMEENKE